MKRNQDGFTLVEMMVTIVIGSLVTLAATTVLLLGLRINNRSTQTVTRQNTARVVITMLENLAAEGEIHTIEYDAMEWKVCDATGNTLVSYDSKKQIIYTGTTPLVEEVTASYVSLSDLGVLTFSLEKGEVSYNTSVYCRTMELPDESARTEPDKVIEEEKKVENAVGKEGRLAFLNALASQYRLKGGLPNPGLILEGQYSTGMYYSQWYLGGSYEGHDGWDIETPWCACFVSWGLCHDNVRDKTASWNIDENSEKNITGGIAFANVDFFWNYFLRLDQQSEKEHWKDAYEAGKYSIPTPGDIVFIDWDGNRDDPAHVGAVLKVVKNGDGTLNSVYTIEGNSAGIVAVRKYTVGENYDIVMGYGIIDWLS